jgi:hypothetical protein
VLVFLTFPHNSLLFIFLQPSFLSVLGWIVSIHLSSNLLMLCVSSSSLSRF